MIFIALYLTALFLAPQLWVGPLVDLRVDLFLYPAWLIYVVVRGRFLQLVRFRAQDWFFLGFVVWSGMAVIASGMPETGLDVLFNLLKWFVLYRLTVATTGGIAGVRRTAHLLILFGLILAIEGIQHYWSEDGLGWAGQSLGWVDEAAGEVGIDRRTRWINIFDGPGVFCVVYTIALPFVLQFLGAPRGWLARTVALAPAGILLLAIYYTGSRGGWITTLVLLGAWFALRSGISPAKLCATAVVAILLAVAGPAYLTRTHDSSKSAQYRVAMWAEGLEMVQQNPLLGIGRGNFRPYTGRLVAHNSAVEIMGEAGLLGLFLWVGVSYTGLKTLLRSIKETDDARDGAYARALVFSIGGYLVSAMFVTLEYETLYFLLALAAATGEDLDDPPRFEARDAGVMVSIVLVFVIVLKVFVMAYFAFGN